MQFKLLGPLEVVDKGRSLPLNGNKQRATLGFLLLHGNSVIATSRILKALWPVDMPVTGRKMLQNAVSGLRGMLSAHGEGPDSALLLTHAPGYLFRVEPDRVDLSRFYSLVNSGRADLMVGSWEQAARTLRNALALWQRSRADRFGRVRSRLARADRSAERATGRLGGLRRSRVRLRSL